MSKIITNSPFFSHTTRIPLGEREIVVLPYQILVWISVSPLDQMQPGPNDAAFPAIFDSGYNGDLLMEPAHLTPLAGITSVADFARLSGGLARGRSFHRYAANLWMHPNKPGTLERAQGPACHLPPARGGFSVFSSIANEGEFALRLPLLGMRGLHGAGVTVTLAFQSCQMSIDAGSPGATNAK